MPLSPLNVGFLIDEKNELPVWECVMLQELLSAEFISEIILIILPAEYSKQPSINESLGVKLFNKFESAWFNKMSDACFASNLNVLNDSFDKLKKVRFNSEKPKLPVKVDLLYVSYRLKDLYPFNPPHYGIWHIEFGRNHAQTDMPGFWEVMNDETTSEARLVVMVDENKEALTAYHAISLTVPYSVKNNFNSMAFKASKFLPYRLRELYLTGPESFFSKCKNCSREQISSIGRKSQAPGSFKMLWLFSKNIFRYLLYKIRKINQKEIFILLFKYEKLDINSIKVENFKRLQPPAKTFWADPFVIKKDDEHYIFFEEGSNQDSIGRIAVTKIDGAGNCSVKTVIIEEPYHLSYPFVFEIDGYYYLIPESSANRTVDLYYCKKFPFEWKFHKRLLNDIVLQDSTFFYFEDIWWLFATSKCSFGSTSNDQLMIYYSSDIFSDKWQSHPCNPVVTDVSSCRPAGKIFVQNKRIFRPAQNNSSRQYGYSIRINEIEVLTTTNYREKMITEISPLNFPTFVAIHTINADEDMIVIDGIIDK